APSISTGLFASDPALIEGGAKAEYWKTGHSHMKRRVHELGALAGFEKSGHYFLAPPIGLGYDDGMRVAVEICKLLDRNPDKSMADLRAALPVTHSSPTMSPYCADEEKYAVIDRLQAKLVAMGEAGESLGPKKIERVVTVNGARVMLAGGAWALVRASSNTPNLVVVCETPESRGELVAIFEALDAVIRTEPSVGDYDQRL
ncbi:MAG: phosphomannomutase/phosphoglucomutase, partial [Pseudomonadota bacterium]